MYIHISVAFTKKNDTIIVPVNSLYCILTPRNRVPIIVKTLFLHVHVHTLQ